MRILVTGAAGFLGRRFVRHHLEAGDVVIGVDNLSSDGSYWPDGITQAHETDLAPFLENLPWEEVYDIAYHLAAPGGGRVRID